MKAKWLERGLVYGPYLTLCTTEAQYHAAMRHLRVPRDKWPPWLEDKAMASMTPTENGSGERACIVCVRTHHQDGTPRTGISVAANLAHEAVHVWQQHRRHIGEDHPSDEFEAYAVEWILRELLHEFARQTGVTDRS